MKISLKRYFLERSLRANQRHLQQIMDDRITWTIVEAQLERENQLLRLKILDTYIASRNA